VSNPGGNQVEGAVAPEVAPEVAPGGGGVQGGEPTGVELAITPEEKRQVYLLRMYRSRMYDIPDARFEEVLEALQNRQSVRSIARWLVEEGYFLSADRLPLPISPIPNLDSERSSQEFRNYVVPWNLGRSSAKEEGWHNDTDLNRPI
jgi:hypothetical protein